MQRILSLYNIRSSTCYLALALVTCIQFGMALTGASTKEAYGQGTAQVVLTGIPPVLSSPYISDLERNYALGLFTTQFIFVSPSRQPQSFRFNLTLEVNGETLIDMTSEPNQYAPGIHVYRTFNDEPAINFPLTYPDIIQQLEASVDQTGLLPEGDYVLSIEPVIEDEQALIPTLPGMAFFSVRYAEPPILLTPFDQSNITTQFPVFSWTPISGAPLTSTFEYELILVEVFPGQAPYQAIESNIPLVREGMVGQTSFVYSMEELPLEERKVYAWQVRARDVNEQMPVLDRGETEFYTFAVGHEGLGSMISSWSFPVSSPFIVYPFENASDLDPSDTEIFIDGNLPIELLGLSSEANFEKLLIDSGTQSIIEGFLTLPEPLALEIAINPLSDGLSGYSAVSSGSALTLSDGLLLEIGTNVRVDASGLHPTGTHKAIVSYTGLPKNEWTATYSNNFTFGFAPFSINRGRVDFASEGVARAYADASGFHLIDQSDPVIAQIPDRLQLPDEDVAFITLKRSGLSLVDIEPAANGAFLVSEKQGVPLELTLPGLARGLHQKDQRYVASLEDVIIDAKTGQLISGKITAASAGATNNYTLDALGIPVAPTSFVATNTPDGVKLEIEGQLTLFGKPVQNTEPIQLTMNAAGVVEGRIAIESSNAYLFLDGEAGNISLDIASVSGTINMPLNAYTSGDVGIDVTGKFNINKGDNIVASANIAFTYAGEGHVKFQHFSPVNGEPQTLSLDSYELEIDEISSLEFFYSNASGLDYVAELQASLLPFNDNANAKLRLAGIELHQNNFYIPTQEGHAGVANFASFNHEVSGARLNLLAYRIPAATVSRKSENGTAQLSPYFDFEVHLDGMKNMPKTIEQFPLTLQDARIVDGIVSGNFIPYQLSAHSVSIPLAAGVFNTDVLSGSLGAKTGAQTVQLEAKGELVIAAPLAGNTNNCSIANVTLTIEADGRMNGGSDPFEPCTAFSIGPVAASFEEATLSIKSDENDTRFILSGSVEAFSRPGSRRTSSAEGTLSVDILTGDVLEADVDAENLFWEFPVAAPQFQISAAKTNLSAEGFTLAGDSTVTINEIESSDAYLLKPQNTFRLGLKPTLSNIGRADLFVSTNPDKRAAYFDETGFHSDVVSEALPQRVLIPGGFGAYIDILQAGEDAVELSKADKAGRTLQTKDDQTALLVLPALGPVLTGSSPTSIELPVSFAVVLNNALEYSAGSFDHDLSANPVKLMGSASPVQITGVRYDESAQQILLSGTVSTPAAINDADAQSYQEIEATFVLDATGLRTVNIKSAPLTLYNETLALTIDEVLIHHQESRLALQLAGQLDSPILKHEGSSSPALRFQSVFNTASASWSFNAQAPASQSIAVDQATLFLDPSNPPAIKTDPTFVLEMAGALAMPASISQDFIADIAIEIGPGGVYAWQTGNLDAPKSFFNGFLTAHLEAIDMRYDAEQQTLVTTIDGAFSPAITQTRTSGTVASGGDNLSDLLPFSGIELSTNGAVSLNARGVESDSADILRLLGDLPRMPVISQSFWIEELILQTAGSGLSVEIEGTVRLPTPDGQRVLLGQSTIGETSSIVYSDRIPVSIILDSEGRAFDRNGAPWQPLLLDRNQPDTTLTSNQRFEITSAYLHFNPFVAEDNRIFTSSQVQLPAIQNSQISDSTAINTAAINTATINTVAGSFISLGDAASTKRHPGLIIAHQQPQQYLVTEIATVNKPALTIENVFFDTEVSSITLPDPEVLQLELGGISRLKTQDIQGYFPVEGITLTPGRIQDYGQSAGPSALTFSDAGLFEIGCADFGIANRSSNTGGFSGPGSNAFPLGQTSTSARISRLQFGRVCGDDLTLTLTDKYLTGSFGNLIFTENASALPEVQITNTQIDLAGLGSLSANLSYNSTISPPSLLVDGTTAFRGINLESKGAIKKLGAQTSVGILFNPASLSVDIMDDVASATIAGGGFFLNPSTEDTELVNLILNERSNNSFSSNKPSTERVLSNQFSMLLPSEIKLHSQDSLAMQGTGLMTVNEHFTMFDLDGAFLNQEDKLSAGVFMVEKNHPDSSRSLEGLANISLNYTSVAGGIVKANFEAIPAGNGLLDWSVYGRSDIDVTDTARLPGQFMLTQAGLLIDLYSAADINTAQLSLKNDLNLTLWSDQSYNKLNGYTAFEAEFDLIPGFALSSVKMFGGIIEDRDESLFYAARNIFADVPFVYTGPIDPWLSFEDGTIYAGDARNTTFRRMITDARQFGNAVPEHTLAATTSLRNALDIQRSLAYDLVKSGELPYFAQSDSLLAGTGDNLLALEKSVLDLDKLPAIFETLSDALYNDENHPDYRRYRNVEATNPRTLAALQTMSTAVDQARRSADSDIFALSGLLPRPLLWNSDYVELEQTLATSPVGSISWPGQPDTEQHGFIVDYDLQNTHSSKLLNFKQSNEGLDVQFLRTIGGLELNMVNLKIARSPEQAIDFNSATSNISKYYAMRIASDWEMLGWTKAKANWLKEQEDGVERGIRENLRTYNNAENSLDEIRSITQQRYDQIRQLSNSTDWKREDLPEDQRFAQYLASLDEDALKEEFETTAKNLWFDVPMAALSSLSDTLASLIEIRNERFATGIDTLNKTYGAFSLALDPLYDIQTRFTTTLYGMAEEYRIWRSSIRRLDPEAVNYAFQFLPYRGNYRILSEDLIPPTIEDIRITPESDGFLNNTKITWTADHPVELIETSLALSYDATATPHFASLSQAPEFQFFTVKPDARTTSRDVNVTLRVRGAGGIPAVKKGQFKVSVDEAAEVIETAADTPLIPSDTSPPSNPQIINLSYSSYFSDTPNSLNFELAPLSDNESGIELIEYRVVNDRDEEDIIQDWTEIRNSTSYFAGRLIETSLPVQEENVSVRVTVRVRNEAGLSAETSESLSLKLDNTKPEASIANVTYFNAFDILHPYALKLEPGPISDEESGIELIEYALQQGGQTSLANADWRPLINFPDRDTHVGSAPVFVDLQDSNLPDSRSILSLYLRITNGAGLQTIVNQTLEIPGRDITPPSEPLVTLEHSGFYAAENNNALRIIVSGSTDLESGIAGIEYRIIDGKTGTEISTWDDFVFLDPNTPTFVLPAREKVIALPSFASSRTIIVETRATNAAGIQSNKSVRFIQLDQDDTQPTAPSLDVRFTKNGTTSNEQSIFVDVGPSEDRESLIKEASYRIVNLATQQPLMNWQPLVTFEKPDARFPGFTRLIDASVIPTGATPGVQVRITNQQNLQTIVAGDLNLASDLTPPTLPSLLIEAESSEDGESTALTLYVGPSEDLESGISGARYQIRDLQHADSSMVAWTDLDIAEADQVFPGKTVRATLPAIGRQNTYRVDVELVNAAGLSTKVSGIVDQEMQAVYLQQQPAKPSVSLFHFDSDNLIRQDELEVSISPNSSVHTEIDSVHFNYTILDEQLQEITSRGRSSWRSIAYRTQQANTPLTTFLPLVESADMAYARVEVRLVNKNGVSPIGQATLMLQQDTAASTPTPPQIDYTYTGYHNADTPNQLALSLNGIKDSAYRIADVSYRITDEQNTSDVVVDWSPVETVNDRGIFQATTLNLVLPEFSRSRRLRIEAKTSNGAGLTSTADSVLVITVDRTAPELATPELVIAGVNKINGTPQLTIYQDELTDPDSKITAVAYRVLVDNDQSDPLVDWTPLELIKSHSLRFPAITVALTQAQLSSTFTVEIEAQNEAGLTANISEKVKAGLDNSAPQMPRVEVSYRESELGTDYLLIEPGAFRDAESKIARLEYRLVDSEDPDFVLIDWITIPVPEEIRVSVAPIAIPRSEILYDGATKLAAEFRATNGAGLFSTRRSTIDLPGDISPPESPSLLVAHRNAYDPLHPNTVEIQIGASEDNQSAIAQAQYRITNASTGEELASWTQLSVASEGYFPGTILFKELPLIENSTSLIVEVEVLNTAGLINTITQNVRVDIQNDATPPISDISLHYFENEMALVLDALSDPESKIQKVEYRFLDNVDQSELMGWTDLFEITIPQGTYPRQSFNVKQPVVNSGRTLKVEVRVTNGAGLQTTVSKTVLVRSPGSDQ